MSIDQAALAVRPHASIKPLRPVSLSLAAVRWHNRVARCSVPLDFTLEQRAYRLRLMPWPIPLANAPVLELAVDGQTCQLALSHLPLPPALRDIPPAGGWSELPVDLRHAVLEAALSPFLEQAARLLDASITLNGLAAEPPAADAPAIGFALTALDADTVTGYLVCADVLPAALERALALYPPPSERPWDALRARVRCQIGATRLSAAELARLARGDVLLLAQGETLSRRALRVCIDPDLALPARMEGGRVLIERVEAPKVANETNTNVINIDELSVELTFDIGTQRIAFRELRQLQPGFTFELERPLDRLVTIHSHGQRIGIGELVEIDGRVGVRVAELYGKLDG